jgi:hypothetical protein
MESQPYRCLTCRTWFEGAARNPRCPSCGSRSVQPFRDGHLTESRPAFQAPPAPQPYGGTDQHRTGIGISGSWLRFALVAALLVGGAIIDRLQASPDDDAPAQRPSAARPAATRTPPTVFRIEPSPLTLRYEETCAPCGAMFVVSSLEQRPITNRIQVQIRITNTGERGTLDFSSATSTASILSQGQATVFASRFEEASAAGQISALLTEVRPTVFQLSHFVDVAGVSSSKPVLAAGESWEGWLVYIGRLPADAAALLVRINTIRGDTGPPAWVSYTRGQPFIPLR